MKEKTIGSDPAGKARPPPDPSIVSAMVVKWAKKSGCNFGEVLKKNCTHVQFLKWKMAQARFWVDEFDGEIPESATTSN